MSSSTIMILIVLLIQVYKLVRPLLQENATGAKVVSTVDAAWDFIWTWSPTIYQVIEVAAQKGLLPKDQKATEFIKKLQDEAQKQGVSLAPAQTAAAGLIASSLAAKDHLPAANAAKSQAAGSFLQAPAASR